MTRVFGLAVSLLSVALVACGGSKQKPAKNASDEITVLVEKDVGEKAVDMPQTFAFLAKKHGCAVVYKPDRTIADCREEGVIGLARNGTAVLIACAGWMTRPQCGQLFNAIANEGEGRPR